jgi:hypothetical protein
MIHYDSIRKHSFVLLMLATLLPVLGCGKSDSGPPPGANTDVTAPSVTLPTDTQGSPTDAAQGSGKPSAPQGEK